MGGLVKGVQVKGQQSTSEYKNRKENPKLWKKVLKRIRIVGHCCISPKECGKDPAEVNYQFGENDSRTEENDTPQE